MTLRHPGQMDERPCTNGTLYRNVLEYRAKSFVDVLNQKRGARYDWNEHIQGYILASYFLGATFGSVFGGFITEYFNMSMFITIMYSIAIICNSLIPLAAKASFKYLIPIRTVMGFCTAIAPSILQTLIAHWAVPDDREMFILAENDVFFALVVVCLNCPLIAVVGWEWEIYVISILSTIWIFCWWRSVSDSPANHPKITVYERQYLIQEIGDLIEKPRVPHSKILQSANVWLMIILHFGNQTVFYSFLTIFPKYLMDVFNYELSSAALITLFMVALRTIVAGFATYLHSLARTYISIVNLKYFAILSHILPGLLFFLVNVTTCNYNVIFSVISLAFTFNGLALLTCLSNTIEVLEDYIGFVYGIMNGFSNLGAMILILFLALNLNAENSPKYWNYYFDFIATIYIVTGLSFFFYGLEPILE